MSRRTLILATEVAASLAPLMTEIARPDRVAVVSADRASEPRFLAVDLASNDRVIVAEPVVPGYDDPPQIVGGRGPSQGALAARVADFMARGAAIERNERHKAAMLAAAEDKRNRKAARRRAQLTPIITAGA